MDVVKNSFDFDACVWIHCQFSLANNFLDQHYWR